MKFLKFKSHKNTECKINPEYIRRIELLDNKIEIDVGTQNSFQTFKTLKVELDETEEKL